MKWMIHLCAVLLAWMPFAQAADVVSNATSGAKFAGLAAAVAAAANGDELVMIGDETLGGTVTISNRTLTLASDGAARTVRGSTNCSYDMVAVIGTNAFVTLGRPGGSDGAPTLIFDGGKNAGVASLYDMFLVSGGNLTIHPGVVLRNLASRDTGPINNAGGFVEMLGGRIENNSAPYGGGIYNNAGEVRISGGSITGNLANVGGGINNSAVQYYQGYIIGYAGIVEMSGGTVAGNVAYQAGGGIYNLGALELSGGRVERNSSPNGGGVLHYNGAQNGMVLRGGAVVADNVSPLGSGIYYNNDANTWLRMAEGGRVQPPNEVWMATNATPILLSGALTGRGFAAQIAPSSYSTNQYALAAVRAEDLWIVSNYYGKFSVTPQSGGGDWFVNEAGRFSRTDPATLPSAIGEMGWSGAGLELGIEPEYVAWDGVLDFATNVVGGAWNFQPVPTNAYGATNGRVVVDSAAPMGVYRMRRR